MTDHPAPEIPARPAEPHEIPRGAARLAALGEANGWMVRTTYARGTRPGRPPRVVDLLMVIARRSGTAVITTWYDTRFVSGLWMVGWAPVRRCTLTELRELVGA